MPTFEVPHPSNPNADLLEKWRTAIPDLRAVVTPDPDGNASGPNYGTTFKESDYARIPPEDLPFGLPAWMGDDAWGRRDKPRHNNAVKRRRRPANRLAGADASGARPVLSRR